jgi:prepilin-type N-terminal cleavage/methylation domain-containing protein
MINYIKNIKNKEIKKRGFTLAELLVVITLLNIVLAASFSFLIYIQNIYGRLESQTFAQRDLSNMFIYINEDIRSASSPNINTAPIAVLSGGQELSIYTFDSSEGKYKNIKYRLNPTNNSQLQRGWVLGSSTQPTDANPNYGTIIDDTSDYKSGIDGKWKTILFNVQYLDGAGDNSVIFKDLTPSSGTGRKSIELTISVKDTNSNVSTPTTTKTIFTSRTRLEN